MRITVEEELKRFPLTVLRNFENALAEIGNSLSDGELEVWAREGTSIANHSPRSWECAGEYFRVSAQVLPLLKQNDLVEWARHGKSLIDQSNGLSVTFFKSSPETLPHIKPSEIGGWAELGRKLYSNSWKTGALSLQFFDASARLFSRLRYADVEQLVYFIEALSPHSQDDATKCLGEGGEVCLGLDENSRQRYLSILKIVAATNWKLARRCFEKGPKALANIEPGARDDFLSVLEEAAYDTPESLQNLLEQSTESLGEIDSSLHKDLLTIAGEIGSLSPGSAGDFLNSLPFLTKRVKMSGLKQWAREGLRLLESNEKAGDSFFRLESSRAEAFLEELSSGVNLQSVRDVLRMYSKALSGKNIQMRSTEDLTGKGIGWTSVERPTTDGATIFLPPYLEEFDTKRENFETFKVLATHQTGHLEFGTFDFSFDKPSTSYRDQRPGLPALSAGKLGTITDFERFFDLFPNRMLARDIFTTVEDARVDFLTRNEYRGIRKSFDRIAASTVAKRPVFNSLPLQEIVIEVFVRLGLGIDERISVPRPVARRVAQCAGLLKRMLSLEATVEDTAECTIRLYSLIAPIPNVVMEVSSVDLEQIDLAEVEKAEEVEGALFSVMAFTDETPEEFFFVDPHRAVEYRSPEQVDFRGDLKPELVQTIMKLRSDGEGDATVAGSPISLEDLLNLLEKSAEIELSQIIDSELGTTAGLFVTNMLREQGSGQRGKKNLEDVEKESEPVPGEPLQGHDPEQFFYDEWDFRAGDYRPQWCCVIQQVLEEDTPDFFDDTLSNYAGLASEIKKQFELLKPEMFKKIKKLNNGEEYDLDEVIQAIVEKKAGQTPSEKIYYRKNKAERDVSVVFLLDMSASTDEEIDKDEPSLKHGKVAHSLSRFGEDSLSLLEWMDEPPKEKGKRIIDIEKESIVLLIKALEAIGDRYGIYGFSGNGRDCVDYYVIKDVNEPFGDKIKRRVSGIKPVQGTRMGAAIRHATAKLNSLDTRFKILILLSDGRPQDIDYGMDRTERDYALQDTKMALNEALRKHIVPFCLTVDKSGTDWLKAMCGDIGYEIVDDITSLPRRLPTLYRRLTT